MFLTYNGEANSSSKFSINALATSERVGSFTLEKKESKVNVFSIIIFFAWRLQWGQVRTMSRTCGAAPW